GLLATGAGEVHEPPQRERGRPDGADLDRDLVGRAADAAGADLESGLDVVERTLEEHDGVLAGLLRRALEGAVDDGLGDGLLAVEEDLVDELGDDRGPVDGVGDQRPLRGRTLTRHLSSPPWRRSGSGPACGS